MDTPALSLSSGRDQVSLWELLQVVSKNRWTILCVTVVFTVGAAVAAWLTPNSYKVKIVISPVSETSQGSMLGGLGGLASQFSGLASIAGLSLTGGSKTAAESQAVLESEALTERYIGQNNLLPILFSRKWNAQQGKWKPMAQSDIPTPWTGFRYFDKHVRAVTTDTKTGLLTLTITWKDPRVAAKWANDLVRLTNNYLRDKALVESDRNIAYLKDQAATTDVVQIKQAIYTLMQSEIDRAMVARGSDEYAFKVLDPAAVPERPSSPEFVIWTLAGTIGGLILSILFVLLRSATVPSGH